MIPKWSIVTPVYLGAYRQAGQDRERKLLRCVNSVLNQNFGHFTEHIIIADGCQKTVDLISANYPYELEVGSLRLLTIPKQKPFSGIVRNTGINSATGEWIAYLDSDDIFGPDHLNVIDHNMNGYDWVFFNDLIWNKDGKFEERTCHIKQYDCGTSNVAHRRSLRARWPERSGYGKDDWQFINELKRESSRWAKISTPEYIVCHIPNRGGYDL